MEHLLSHRARAARSSVIRDLLKVVEQPGMLSMAGGLPAAESFPVARMREAVDRVLGASDGLASPLQYGPTEGVMPLRAWVAEQMGGDTLAEQVVITTGSQQALDLLAHALCDPGDPIVVEEPAYVGALQAFDAAAAAVVAVPADAHGLCVDLLADRLAAGLRPRACYVAPNFQNPTGATLAVERRRALAGLADRYDFVVIEDDPYRELRFRGEHLPTIGSFGTNVVTLGSTSKVLAPGLRVGWMVAPAPLVPAMVRLKQSRDLHTSSLSQWLAHDVLSDAGFLAGHRRTLAALYAEREASLAGALTAEFGDRIAFDRPDGGMFLWAQLAGVDTTALLPKAAAAGVAFVPGGAFHIDGGGTDRARLSFATLRADQVDEAVRRLSTAMTAMSA